MKRILEPELMEDDIQVQAYASVDFSERHTIFVDKLCAYFPDLNGSGAILDLGCGTGDIALRLANRLPECQILGVDGSAAMISVAKDSQVRAGFSEKRVEFLEGVLPGVDIPELSYAALVSNGFLHHLHNSAVLWDAVKMYASEKTKVFIVDLIRPETEQRIKELVEMYASNTPEIHKRDLYNSLRAAFTPTEVREQLLEARLLNLSVEVISDRHMMICGDVR